MNITHLECEIADSLINLTLPKNPAEADLARYLVNDLNYNGIHILNNEYQKNKKRTFFQFIGEYGDYVQTNNTFNNFVKNKIITPDLIISHDGFAVDAAIELKLPKPIYFNYSMGRSDYYRILANIKEDMDDKNEYKMYKIKSHFLAPKHRVLGDEYFVEHDEGVFIIDLLRLLHCHPSPSRLFFIATFEKDKLCADRLNTVFEDFRTKKHPAITVSPRKKLNIWRVPEGIEYDYLYFYNHESDISISENKCKFINGNRYDSLFVEIIKRH